MKVVERGNNGGESIKIREELTTLSVHNERGLISVVVTQMRQRRENIHVSRNA